MGFPPEMLEEAHRHCACHRGEVSASTVCGCFSCCHTFPTKEIRNWVHETSGPFSLSPDPWTAVCPNCEIDAVIGDASGFPISDPKFLDAMHTRWLT